uniref:DNA ligase (ATP) n=1 Tax=Solibacter usitatus (strain Ellin6076) TaxID=234267 RepID=Q022T8_SOLUE
MVIARKTKPRGVPTEPVPGPIRSSTHKIGELMARFPEVQLATLVAAVPTGENWVQEIKFDGYRLLGFRWQQSVRLITRNGKDWTESFPSLSAALSGLAVDSAVLDMEAVVLDGRGKSSFQALQNALGEGGDRRRIVAYVFDLLYLNGRDLTKLTLLERKEQLETILGTFKILRYSNHVIGQGEEMLAKACEAGLEGIISKEANAAYLPGRSRNWLKIKCSLRQEFVIVGYSDPRKGGRALGALYLGYRKNGALQYAGKVGTGFTMKSARELTDRLSRISVHAPVLSRTQAAGLGAGEWRAVHWVKPIMLCEVAFTEWTGDGRIRHPSFQGLREDKSASEVKKEMPVAPKDKTKAIEGKKVLHGITITHPERVISDTGQITKGELAEYYAAVAPWMLPHIARHPLSLLRCPAGIDKQCFFQRNPGKGLGADVHPFEFKNKGKTYEYLYIEDEAGLLEVIQMGAVELHPWGASIDSIDYPDRMIFDLDPAPEVPFEALKLAAQDLRKRLQRNGLESSLKCTGGKGLHVTVPLAATDSWSMVKRFAASIADEMVAATPEAYVATMSKAKRTGRIFIDYFRNDYTATAIADYSVRARPGAPVALPIDWKELKNLESASQFTMKDVLSRLRRKKKTPAALFRYTIPAG